MALVGHDHETPLIWYHYSMLVKWYHYIIAGEFYKKLFCLWNGTIVVEQYIQFHARDDV